MIDKMNTITVNRILIFNLIISILIIFDVGIPGKESEIKELNAFYSFFVGSNNRAARRTYEWRHFVQLSDGERYRIARIPNKDYKKGQKVKIIKSRLFNNVNEVMILEVDDRWEKIYVGLIYFPILMSLFVGSIIISVLNISFKHRFLNIALIVSMVFLAVIFFVYFRLN